MCIGHGPFSHLYDGHNWEFSWAVIISATEAASIQLQEKAMQNAFVLKVEPVLISYFSFLKFTKEVISLCSGVTSDDKNLQ